MTKIQLTILPDGAKIPLTTFSISVTLLSSVANSQGVPRTHSQGVVEKGGSWEGFGSLGGLLAPLGVSWEPLGSLLGCSWRLLEPLGIILDPGGPQKAPKTSPEAPKSSPRWRNSSRKSQEGLKRIPRRPNRLPRGPKELSLPSSTQAWHSIA